MRNYDNIYLCHDGLFISQRDIENIEVCGTVEGIKVEWDKCGFFYVEGIETSGLSQVRFNIYGEEARNLNGYYIVNLSEDWRNENARLRW